MKSDNILFNLIDEFVDVINRDKNKLIADRSAYSSYTYVSSNSNIRDEFYMQSNINSGQLDIIVKRYLSYCLRIPATELLSTKYIIHIYQQVNTQSYIIVLYDNRQADSRQIFSKNVSYVELLQFA